MPAPPQRAEGALDSPGDSRECTMPRNTIPVPHGMRLPYIAHPHTTRGAQDLHAEPSLDPCWILAAGTASHTWGNVTDAAQETKLLFMPWVCVELAATAGQQQRQTHGSCTGQKHTTASIICVLGQRETNYYSHSEKQLTKITISKDPCY